MKFSSQGLWLLALLPIACYAGNFFAGHPCTKDADCGSLTCIQGICGGGKAQGTSSSSSETTTSLSSSSSTHEATSTTSTGTTDDSTTSSPTTTMTEVTETASTTDSSTTSTTTMDSTGDASTTNMDSSTSDTGEPTPEEVCAEYCRLVVCCGAYLENYMYTCDAALEPQDTETKNYVSQCMPSLCFDFYNEDKMKSEMCGMATLKQFECVGNISSCSDFELYETENGDNWPCKEEANANILACS